MSPLERWRGVVYGIGEAINTPSEREPNNLSHFHPKEGRSPGKVTLTSATGGELERKKRRNIASDFVIS